MIDECPKCGWGNIQAKFVDGKLIPFCPKCGWIKDYREVVTNECK